MKVLSLRVNIGCGPNPIPGWVNFDNSLSVRLAAFPVVVPLLDRLGFLGEGQKRMIRAGRENTIFWADAAHSIPLPDGSVEILYCSHMIEHLDREQAQSFLKEAYRVLQKGGIIRLVVPDLRRMAEEYIKYGDADKLIAKTLLATPQLRNLREKIKLLLVGYRHHLWMYDGSSLVRLLLAAGFSDAHVFSPGQTLINNPVGLDLYERMDESVYVEGHNGSY